MKENDRIPWGAVIVAAAGYFVDLFDTFQLPALRVQSLHDLGVPDAQSLAVYAGIMNWQLFGMALGALFLWGPFADRSGRRRVLLASILVYAVANALTAAVHSVGQYEVIRFLAGVGLGGELGAGITLVSENMGTNRRGVGTMVVGFCGMLGVVAAATLAKSSLHWRTDYIIGGVLGLGVLALRIGVGESRLFTKNQVARKALPPLGAMAYATPTRLINRELYCDLGPFLVTLTISRNCGRVARMLSWRGMTFFGLPSFFFNLGRGWWKSNYFRLLRFVFSLRVARNSSAEAAGGRLDVLGGDRRVTRSIVDNLRDRPLIRYVLCVLVGAPTFFVTGLLVPGAPEFGRAFGMKDIPSPATALIWTYTMIAVGDILCGVLSQLLTSRKKALLVFHGVTALGICAFLFAPPSTPSGFYARCVVAGLGIGFWANMVTNAAEQFGTNVRATIAITVPNFVRFLLFPISFAFLNMKPSLGIVPAAAVVGLTCSALAIVSILVLKDCFSKNLDYNESLVKPGTRATKEPRWRKTEDFFSHEVA